MRFQVAALAVVLNAVHGFQTPLPTQHSSVELLSRPGSSRTVRSFESSHLFASQSQDQEKSKRSILKKALKRFDTIESAGLQDVKVAGFMDKIKKLHGPKTYLVMALGAGLKWKWCFRNPYYWFAVAFCVKWYRARYVFKIPVWDRQPNWNNIITSKEQEEDLKAFTCKTCGSTLFIAKTREFFFEGDTGIGGLGCFSCGTKGKDNFVMDRDRIVEDVADVDDYFEYERPLDFVSRAERRKLLKEAEGDEEKANEILLNRSTDASSETSTKVEDETLETDEETSAVDSDESQEDVKEEVSEKAVEEADESAVEDEDAVLPKAEAPKPKITDKKKEQKKKPSSTPPLADDDLDVLDMD